MSLGVCLGLAGECFGPFTSLFVLMPTSGPGTLTGTDSTSHVAIMIFADVFDDGMSHANCDSVQYVMSSSDGAGLPSASRLWVLWRAEVSTGMCSP